MSANETNEEKPALNTMTAMMRAVLSWKMGWGRAEEAWMKRLPKNPNMFKKKMMEELENWNLLEIQLPRLQNTADDKLAYRPTSAISLWESPVPSRKMPNMPP